MPPRAPYRLIPLFSCIASPTNQKTDLVFLCGSFFFIFSLFMIFFAPFLAISDPPVCLQLCPRSAYGADSSDIPFQMMKVQKQSSFFTIVLILDLGPLKKSFWRSVMQFYPSPEAQSAPKVLISTYTPIFMYYLANQQKKRSCLQISFIIFHFLLF